MAALSRFVSAGGDKGHPYFQCLKRNSRFVWTREVQRGVCEAEGVLGQPTGVVQARAKYPAPPILRGHIESNQFGPVTGARPGADANLLRQQSVARARGEIPGLRKGGSGSSILGTKTLPLLLELHCDSDNRPSYSQGLTKARCGRQNGAMGSRVV